MQHLDEGTIHSWLDGALSVDEAARVEAHVKECPECAAAVAEARGFIAGSSRILTALDNAPRGVMPAAVPKKRLDPFVWRVAATIMVVAAGTLVVVQNRGSDERVMSLAADSVALLPDSTSVSELSGATGSAATAQTANTPTAVAPPVTASTGARATEGSKAIVGTAPSSALSKKGEVGDQLARRNTDERRTLEAAGSASAGQQSAASSGLAAAAAPPPARVSALSSRIAGVAMDAATEPEPLKVVGTPRRIGMKVTLYEVAPGDTVTLTEPTMVALGAVVTTGANVAAKAARTERAMVPQSVARPDAAAAAPDSPRGAVLQSAPTSTTPAPPAPVRQVEVANGVTTISWTELNTGKELKLSGRMSEARLQQIKLRIERERAAAAKKIP